MHIEAGFCKPEINIMAGKFLSQKTFCENGRAINGSQIALAFRKVLLKFFFVILKF